MAQLRVLLTGPSGRVGPYLLPSFETLYDLHTFDMVPSSRPQSHVGTLQDLDSLRAAMRGVDVVVHLAATSDEAPFMEELLPNNIAGMYNLMSAAQLEGVRRVVFTSSVQTILQNLDDIPKPIETEVQSPSSLYGVTKIFGEVLGKWYHDRHGIEFVAIRLGWFQDKPARETYSWINNIWISPGDAALLFQKAIETPGISYAVVNGVSNTPDDVLSLKSARELLNYEPQDHVLALSPSPGE